MYYQLTLVNQNPSLDFEEKEPYIREVIEHIAHGGMTGTSYSDVKNLKAVSISKREIVLQLNETDTTWHAWVGKQLVKYPGMRRFCDPSNSERMFIWDVIT